MAKKCPKVQKVSKRRDFIALMLLSAPRIGDFLNNFGIIGFKMQHHKISQMSPRFLWYIMMFYLICMWRHHFGSFRSKTRHHDQKDTSSFDISGFGEYFGHHFGILRSKSRHHQRPECLLLMHLRSLMMPDFVSFFMHILASWDLKVGIIIGQSRLGFGISGLSWCLLLWLMMPKGCLKRCQNNQMDESRVLLLASFMIAEKPDPFTRWLRSSGSWWTTHSISNRHICCFSCQIAMVHRISPTVEI